MAMLAAAPLSPIARPKIAPAANKKKNFPAKVNAPSGPAANPVSNESARGITFVMITTRALRMAANIMSTPRNAIHINSATLPIKPR